MSLILVYLASLVAFLGIDALWLSKVMRPLFERHVGALLRDEVQFAAAGGFYALYVAGILHFATLPGLRGDGVGAALLNGAILGFLAYGTYEATNMSTLKGWTWGMVATDVAWGMALTALTACVGYYAGAALGLGSEG